SSVLRRGVDPMESSSTFASCSRVRALFPVLSFIACLLAGGCAAGLENPVSPAASLAGRRSGVLTTGRLSTAAREVIGIVGIVGCQGDSPGCRRALLTAPGITDEQRFSTLAELWTEAALAADKAGTGGSAAGRASDPVLDAWLESARYSWAY